MTHNQAFQRVRADMDTIRETQANCFELNVKDLEGFLLTLNGSGAWNTLYRCLMDKDEELYHWYCQALSEQIEMIAEKVAEKRAWI